MGLDLINNKRYKLNIDYNTYINYQNNLTQLIDLSFNGDVNTEEEIEHLMKYTNTKIGIETGMISSLCISSILDTVYSIYDDDINISIKEILEKINNIKLLSFT